MTKQKPEVGTEVKAEVKGYGCAYDCKEYHPNTSALMGCRLVITAKGNILW